MSDPKQPVGTLPLYAIIIKGETVEEVLGERLSALREEELKNSMKLKKHEITRRFVRYETATPGAF